MLDDVNYQLLAEFGGRSHPNMDETKLHPGAGVHFDWVAMNAKVCHHLLDLVGIPLSGERGDHDLDARMYLLLRRVLHQAEIVGCVKDLHHRETAEGGTFGDFCEGCDRRWPCETYMLAVGQLDENREESKE